MLLLFTDTCRDVVSRADVLFACLAIDGMTSLDIIHIPKREVCDGIQHCDDYDDEVHCPPPKGIKPTYGIEINNNYYLFQTYVHTYNKNLMIQIHGGHVISTYICFYMVSMTQYCTITGTMLVPVHYSICTLKTKKIPDIIVFVVVKINSF